ncbi:hypothetical protein SYJ56_19260 [Algoriphagus sp. D3-2-R+10]|uniref:hypothetical protein n=1 Tax=Algoriphagus aurantiacus TaxID=3103948 RepID=UPI002B3D8137|nr:hypothetical protein [Algoriphagus sp. D3-2-R+10]MEB2777462.1 hypothetical protein [Algoriphagus sp. D3-2-R+10]
MNLIFIHGRAQQGKDPKKLKKLWIDTLIKGLEKSNLSLPIQENQIYFPFYGDSLNDLIFKRNRPIEEIVKKGGEAHSKDDEFFHDFLMEVSKNANITTSEIEEEQINNIKEKGPLNWEWVQVILRTLDKRTKWSVKSLKKFTYDVYVYLTQENIKESINNLVLKDIDPSEPCVVVGHSLGSIVGYNILRDHSDLNVCKYITVGSPLGLKSVKKYLKTPIKMPDCVQDGWYNAYDDRDVVALNPLDKRSFNITPTITNKKDVLNQTKNRHGIVGYLNDKSVAKEIYDALTKEY